MNTLQEKPTLTTFEPPTAATRPFTRVLNVFCDHIKPAMKKNKVDRSVLDAIVRLLEGFHRSSIVITIAELAARAGVSNSSVSAALTRLEAAGLITRRRKLLKERSRFIWEIALVRDYRVVQPAEAPPVASPKPGRRAPAPVPLDPELPSVPSPCAEAPVVSAPEPAASPSTPRREEAPPKPEEPTPDRPDPDQPAPRHRQKVHRADLPDKPRRKPAELTPEQRQLVDRLRSARIDYHMACKLVRAHSASVIDQVLANLRHRAGTIRNPAAWLVREIERGGYSPPSAAADQVLQAERAARLEEQRQAETRERERAEETNQAVLRRFAALPPDRQAELEREVRAALRRVSPRLADAPWDLTSPGPVRSQLLALVGEDPT